MGYLSTLLIIVIIVVIPEISCSEGDSNLIRLYVIKKGFDDGKIEKDGTIKDRSGFNKVIIDDDYIKDRNGYIIMQLSSDIIKDVDGNKKGEA